MASIGVKFRGIERVQRFYASIPPDLLEELEAIAGKFAAKLKTDAGANLQGGMLNVASGRLLGSLDSETFRNRTKAGAVVFSPVHYGRFWERGFTRQTRTGPVDVEARPWLTGPFEALRPAARDAMERAMNEVTRRA